MATLDAPTDDRPRLDQVDEDAESVPADGQRSSRAGRRRRPTGEPPPLPADQRWRGVRWALVALAVLLFSIAFFVYLEPGRVLAADLWISRQVVGLRTDATVDVAQVFDRLADPAVLLVLRWSTIAVLLFFRRLRHLAVFLGALFVVEWTAQALNFAVQRPRPMVEIVGDWSGFSHPSRPMAALTVTTLGALRVLVPRGSTRRNGAIALGVLLGLVGTSRVVLGIDHTTDVVVAVLLGAGAVFALTRLLVPHERHPIEYRRGESAHLTLSDDRRDALSAAVRDQLGLEVTSIELFAPDGSAGSTPLKIEVDGDDGPGVVFAKLYSRQHLRSDRLYKFVRLLAYGRLENETPFTSVRRLVEYEDHMTRVLMDHGIDVPASLGIVEITPEREYLLAFEMRDGEDFQPDVEVSDELIDHCLELVRDLWVAGVAHRDIKPGNLLVHGDDVVLIDVAFAQLRPSPWRQAVDLGAMLLLLSLAADPERVHARATEVFSEEEIAEALAATDGFAIPSQLRDLLEEDGWRVKQELCALVPERDPIRVHRWDRRRILAAVATGAVAIVAAFVTWSLFDTVQLL